MKIGFNVYDWKDIMKVCGSVAEVYEERIMLTYIKIDCDNGRFTAYGSNGFQLSRLCGRCEMDDNCPVSFLLPVMKTPPKTAKVEIMPKVEVLGGKTVLYFYDKNGNVTTTTDVEIPDGEYIDAANFFKRAEDGINLYNHGQGSYMVAVNPRYLMNALEGMKGCESVILNFASPVEAFMIRPYKEDLEASALVYPVRIM